MNGNPEVDVFFDRAKHWKPEMAALRSIMSEFDVDEVIKWGKPCYQVNGTNSMLIGPFKDHCVLSFFKGALLSDPKGLLIQPGQNTQSARVLKFTSAAQITRMAPVIRRFVGQAIANEVAGRSVVFSAKDQLELIPELAAALAASPTLKAAFDGLTPGRRRAYNMFFGSAKRSETRQSRIKNATARIIDGKGLNDR